MASGNESDEYINPYCDKCSKENGYHLKDRPLCKTCNLFLCEKCELKHEKNEEYDKHEVVRGSDVARLPAGYQICTRHSKSENYLSHFCKYHACLVCPKCARKMHRDCLVVPVGTVCHEIKRLDIKDFERVVLQKKSELLSTKVNLDTKSRKQLENQYNAVLMACQDMHTEHVAKLDCLQMQFQTELEEIFNKHSKIISSQIAEIDTIVDNLDEVCRDLLTIETEYKHGDENLFIRIQESVVKINHYLEDFRRIENSRETVSLKFLANEELNNFITRVNSLGTLKLRIKSLKSASHVDDVVFPPTPRGNR